MKKNDLITMAQMEEERQGRIQGFDGFGHSDGKYDEISK